jgi:ankyrin repeat protein
MGHDKVVGILLTRFQTTINVNIVTDHGLTPLIAACWKGHENVVRLLLGHDNTDVNQSDDDGCTPLFMACKMGHKRVVRLLLDHSETNVNKPDNQGRTPLYAALHAENKELAIILIEHDRVDPIEISNYSYNVRNTYSNALLDVQRRRRGDDTETVRAGR